MAGVLERVGPPGVEPLRVPVGLAELQRGPLVELYRAERELAGPWTLVGESLRAPEGVAKWSGRLAEEGGRVG